MTVSLRLAGQSEWRPMPATWPWHGSPAATKPAAGQASDAFILHRPRFGSNVRFASASPASVQAALPPNARRGLFISPEFDRTKEGGLGEVSEQIPMALSHKDYGGMDCRVIIPYLKPQIDYDREHPAEGFQPTGLKFLVKGPGGERTRFEVMERRFHNILVYALKNNDYLSHLKSLYSYNPNKSMESEVVARATLLFNQAAAQLAPMLNPSTPLPKGARVTQFGRDADFVIANDWMTSGFLHYLPKQYKAARLFILHNEIDKAMGFDDALRQKVFKNERAIPEAIRADGYYSPLSLGIKLANVVIGDPNYIRGLAKRLANSGAAFIKHLQEKVDKGLFYGVHHDPGDRFNPINHTFWKSNYGFSPLRFDPTQPDTVMVRPPVTGWLNQQRLAWIERLARWAEALEAKRRESMSSRLMHGRADTPGPINRLRRRLAAMLTTWAKGMQAKIDAQFPLQARSSGHAAAEFDRFKRENRLALQRKYGLTPDPDAVIFSWVARFEPFQKGFFMLVKSLQELLAQNPKAQLVVGGMMTDNPRIDGLLHEFFTQMSTDPRLKGRVAVAGRVPASDTPEVHAGSSFIILPSLYEPFGLSQLEAMRMGSIPIVHGVDGLLSSVNDPAMPGPHADPETRTFYATAKRPPAHYGQTGIVMRRIAEVNGYRQGLSKAIEEDFYQLLVRQMDRPAQAAFGRIVQDALATSRGKFEPFMAAMQQALNAADNPILQARPHSVLPHFAQQYLAETAKNLPDKAQPKWMKEMRENDALWTRLVTEAVSHAQADRCPPEQRAILTDAQASFNEAMNRAFALAQNPTAMRQVALNGMRYVNAEHRWARIAQDYKAAVEHALNEAGRTAPAQPSQPAA